MTFNTDCHSTTFNIIQGLNTTAILELFVVYAILYSILYSVTKYLGHDRGVPLNTSYAFYLYIIIVYLIFSYIQVHSLYI